MAPTVPEDAISRALAAAVNAEDGCLGIYPLRTDRLLLRPVGMEHLEAIVRQAADLDVTRYTARMPHPYTLADGQAFLAEALRILDVGLGVVFAIERRGDGALMGLVGLDRSTDATDTAEIGYWIGREHWLQGFGAEAVHAVLAHAFDDLGFARVLAMVVPENEAGVAIVQSLNFAYAHHMEVEAPARPAGALEVAVYGLNGADFRAAQASRLLLVSAVALLDPDNRILLQKRPEGKELAGLWEFPGGKVDPGETPERALIRELQEELGIDVRESCLAPLAFASHAYKGFHLLMPLYVCRQWKGRPEPREGQELAWVAPNRLGDYPMPPADIPLIPILRDWLI